MAQENSSLIRRWFEEVWNKGRMEAIDEMASPDAIGHGQAQHDTDIGLREFRIFAMDLRRAFPDFKVTIDRVIEQGDIVVARWTTTMTHEGEFLGFPATGKKVTVTGTSMQRVAERKDRRRLGQLGSAGAAGADWRRPCGAFCGSDRAALGVDVPDRHSLRTHVRTRIGVLRLHRTFAARSPGSAQDDISRKGFDKL